jgi:hypothetical protein
MGTIDINIDGFDMVRRYQLELTRLSLLNLIQTQSLQEHVRTELAMVEREVGTVHAAQAPCHGGVPPYYAVPRPIAVAAWGQCDREGGCREVPLVEIFPSPQ